MLFYGTIGVEKPHSLWYNISVGHKWLNGKGRFLAAAKGKPVLTRPIKCGIMKV